MLKKACEGRIPLPKQQPQTQSARKAANGAPDQAETSKESITIATCKLPDYEWVKVYLAEIDDPNLIFLNRASEHER